MGACLLKATAGETRMAPTLCNLLISWPSLVSFAMTTDGNEIHEFVVSSAGCYFYLLLLISVLALADTHQKTKHKHTCIIRDLIVQILAKHKRLQR